MSSRSAKSRKAAKAPAKKKAKKVCTRKTVKRGKRRVSVKVCRPVKAKAKARPKAPARPTFTADAPVVLAPAHVPAPVAVPADPVAPPAGPVPVLPPVAELPPPIAGELPVQNVFGAREAERLLWRAGFGPRPGDVERVAALGLEGAVRSLTRPAGAATLTGPEPRTADGDPLAPGDLWGHDVLWWLDRMVRSDQPLVERMALVWHDWFACSIGKTQTNLLLAQNELFRSRALGSFRSLLREVTIDPAMLDFLDGIRNSRRGLNENYAREVMELFTLGAGRGAYTETDIREAAKALTGWAADWSEGAGIHNFRYVATRHQTGSKTIFGQSGDFGWEDVVNLCVDHPAHASYFVARLWSHFVGAPPDAGTASKLEALYVQSGHEVRPVLEAILRHPALYRGPAMVKPPAVYLAGLLRGCGRGVQTEAWAWLMPMAGQRLFEPPNVAGWDESAWLDSSTWRGRWEVAAHVLWHFAVDPWAGYSATETPTQAVEAAVARFGSPSISDETRGALLTYAATCIPATARSWEQGPFRGYRQNALRMLVMTCADLQTS